MTVKERLEALRILMKEKGVDAYLVPTDDFHGSEYVGDYFKCRKYITGFTGSAGTAVIMKDMAGLWTDGRYFIQAADQLKGSTIELFKSGESGVPTVHEFLKERSEIDVVMENVFDRQWQPLMDVKRKVQEINFALCLDIGHANCYSHLPVTEWVKNLFPYIEHMHVHDNMGEKDSHLALGQGSIEIEKVFKKVKKSKCTYTIECNTKDDVRESWRKLKGLLE